MNITIEQAIKSWLEDSTELAGQTILCGQSDEEVPNDAPFVMIDCNDTRADSPALYVATIRILVSSPCVMENSLTDHRATVANLRELLKIADGMASYFPANLVYKGIAINGWNDSQGDERWVSAVNLVIGLVDVYG
jgi:hypothetical protein